MYSMIENQVWKLKIEYKPTLDIKNQRITFDVTEYINESVVNRYKDVINLKEKAIRSALIQLGWTPPGKGKK